MADIRLSNFPPNRGLVAEIVSVVWVIGRGKGYGVCDVGGLGLDGTAEVLGGERVGVLGGVRLGELCGEEELLEWRGDWRGDCWGESCVEV